MLQEDLASNSSNYQPESGGGAASSQDQWRQKLFSGGASSENEFKQMSRGFSLDQPQFSSQASSNDSTITSQSLTPAFQVDSAAAYGLLLSENQHHHTNYQNRPLTNFPYPSGAAAGGYAAEMMPPSMNKYPPFLRTSPPKGGANHLHFTNNTPFWNAAAPPPPAVADARSGFFPPLQNQIPTAPSFDSKPKVHIYLHKLKKKKLLMHDNICIHVVKI